MNWLLIVLAVIGLWALGGDKLLLLARAKLPAVFAWFHVAQPAPTETALDSPEARKARLLTLLRLIAECDAVGAKGAASKLRTAASSVVQDDFLREV